MQTYFFQSFKQTILLTSLFLSFLAINIHAQDQTPPENLFFEVACFKAKSPNTMAFFEKWSKPIHEEMIRQGILLDWDFYTVDYPNGSDCDCQYRAVRIFKDIASLDKIKSEKIRNEIVKKIWPGKSIADVREDFRKNVEFKHAEVYKLVDALIPSKTTSKLLVVNFMDVKPMDRKTYLDMELEIFKPLHASSHKANILVDWFVAEREIPYGVNVKTDYITVDKFNSYEDYYSNNFSELFKSTHPTLNFEETMQTMAKKRSLLKAEIWRYVPNISANPLAESTND